MHADSNPNIITIDGPSGVGKGTIAQLISESYGFHLLDSGALYRLVGTNAQRLGLDLDSADDAIKAVLDMDVEFKDGKTHLHGEDVSQTIRTLAAGQLASRVAVHSSVRDKLFDFMQAFVRPPGIVADGRDMGTVVFPNADVKLFLTASPEIRAKRRYKQLRDNGKDVTLSAVFSELAERDSRDKGRTTAPLEPAKDAVLFDTGALTAAQVFSNVQALLAEKNIIAVL